MRYCHQCHRITTGEPLFCNSCGSSYDTKLCPSRHANPRSAEVCSTCGSRDLSTPAPRVPLWLMPVLLGVALLPGIVIALLLVLVAAGIVHQLLTNQQVQGHAIALLFILALLWFAYIHLPKFIRDLFRQAWSKKKKDSHSH